VPGLRPPPLANGAAFLPPNAGLGLALAISGCVRRCP
jgi:hypothetical protein